MVRRFDLLLEARDSRKAKEVTNVVDLEPARSERAEKLPATQMFQTTAASIRDWMWPSASLWKRWAVRIRG